jgi:hypothetical protein
MIISDSRYTRDLRRYQLAWRLIGHGARNRTVEQWSGLSMYRVRALYRSYAGACAPCALRGVAPHQVAFFFRSAEVQCEAAVLGGLLSANGVVPDLHADLVPEHLVGVGRGERLCQVYEEFTALRPDTAITVEHAILLLTELVRGIEVQLGSCPRCHVLVLRDCLALEARECAHCLYERYAGRSRLSADSGDRNVVSDAEPSLSADPQGQLF